MEFSDLPLVEHPAFPQPRNINVRIWRYIDMAKFQSLVTTKRLYMARADTLGDDFEGSTPAAEKAEWQARAELAASPEERQTIEINADQLSEYAATFRQTYYVSCWHMNDDENVAMWERYVKNSPESVAIASSYSILREELAPKAIINLGVVRYIDYDKQSLPSLNMLHRITHKRHFYFDEREVRTVVWAQNHADIMRDHIEPRLTSDRRGFLQPVEPSRLISRIVLNPSASPAFAADVIKLCEASGLPRPMPSRMATTPVF